MSNADSIALDSTYQTPGSDAGGTDSPGWNPLAQALDFLGGEAALLPGTIQALPRAYIDTALSGEQADSLAGYVNGLGNHFLRPFGGNLNIGPIYGHQDARDSGDRIGEWAGFAMDLAMLAYGLRGGPIGLTLPETLRLPLGGLNAALVGGGSLALPASISVPVAGSVYAGLTAAGAFLGGNFLANGPTSFNMEATDGRGGEDVPNSPTPPIRTGKWGQGGYGSAEDSLKAHFAKHGAEVGATDLDQYLRKAEGFAQNLRGATKSPVQGATPNVTRYKKLGKYIDLDADGNIISFGSQ